MRTQFTATVMAAVPEESTILQLSLTDTSLNPMAKPAVAMATAQ